ncbi:MAG: hypothetical protein A2068_04705 [Ignavibacteria bacterium GWB2_35_6b]|nr:MAG: hypothetical protein A2068_04705 [Ignavibacteria bacterium GWB2_35_6b]
MSIEKNYGIVFILLIVFTTATFAQSRKKFEEVKKYSVPEARQGVAVDKDYFYAIDTRGIAKYEKVSGKLVKKWEGKEGGPIKHLDSGVILDGRLYCAHSNYPEFPMTSSIEIFDPETLEHTGTHSFGINWGSCTWVDRHQGFWWAAFAHYNKWKDSTKTDVRWTRVIKFDDQWRELESWIFPKEVLYRFENMSNSGGAWGPDGNLYCTGHDPAEVYVLKIPSKGSILELVDIIPVNCTGQGIAWDKSEPGSIYTISKAERKVIHSKLAE